MKLNWIVTSDYGMNLNEFHRACYRFHDQYKCAPDTAKLFYDDFQRLVDCTRNTVAVLEKNKDYGIFIVVPGGVVELLLLDEESEATVVASSGTKETRYFTLESSKVDRDFEKHILNSEVSNESNS